MSFFKTNTTTDNTNQQEKVLRNFTKLTKNCLCRSLFLIKLHALDQQVYQKRDSSTGVFLLILGNFVKKLFSEQIRIKNPVEDL